MHDADRVAVDPDPSPDVVGAAPSGRPPSPSEIDTPAWHVGGPARVPVPANESHEVTKSPYRVFLLHHTHWDREWWATYQDFRIRLVELIDDLLDTIDRDPSFRTFLLDSQTVVLRDYLAVRPEERERLVRAIRGGRIECGPWYILPDEFLVSGEAHIRNLLLARRIGRELDIPLLAIGYIPDTFGHIAQMPQILRGFGIDNAFLWRGRGGDAAAAKQEFRWRAPDGSAVLAHWFPSGYYQMPFLHFGNPDRPEKDKLGRIFDAIELWGPRATTDVLLMPYGGDHRPSDPGLAAKIAEANEAIQGRGVVRWATAAEYVEAIREQEPDLETVSGELRTFGPEHPHLLPGVLSARLALKQRNWWGETWLERYAEPLSALAWLAGARYDAGLLWQAWELLIQNHPHDSICGCSIDQVHREMLPRFEQSRQIAEILAARSADSLHAAIDTSDLRENEQALVVRNPLAEERSDWAACWFERQDISPHTHALLDADGREVPFTARAVDGIRPRTDRWQWTEIGFVAEGVPGLGYRTYRLVPRPQPLDRKLVHFAALHPTAALKGSDRLSDLVVGDGVIENRWLRVAVERDGTLTITDRISGERYAGLNAFEDGGDAGDTYNYAAPLGNLVLRSDRDARRVHVSVAEASHGRAMLRVEIDWELPAGLSDDRLSRRAEYVPYRLRSLVTLLAGARRVEIRTEWENTARDHRLRALFPLGRPVDRSIARGQFAVITRPVVADPGNGWPEPPTHELPQDGWSAVEADGRGLLIAARGLPEHEALPDGTLALTILRAVGWLSREDNPARIGGAGPETPTPDAQQLGLNRAEYTIIPYAGDWLGSGAWQAAEDWLAPFYAVPTGRHAGTRPWSGGAIEMAGAHSLILSAVKKAEESDALIVRWWNAADRPTEARVRFARRLRSIWLVDLKEERVGDGARVEQSIAAGEFVGAGPSAGPPIGLPEPVDDKEHQGGRPLGAAPTEDSEHSRRGDLRSPAGSRLSAPPIPAAVRASADRPYGDDEMHAQGTLPLDEDGWFTLRAGPAEIVTIAAEFDREPAP